ncbi:hypothetical protein [Candidatus Nucleicultrix amoebiphila]|jgi:hypothetical protein|uniref:Uncharacterized protein n=1 Tax=Candidatus Nucleicultrix amoebiphila FS5 TaxID=1414854 RepID=A0A1W6N2K9_9PROT|nr:hypothetical protein [Candidatus Nucleicultrix amoebiphila]ARN84006.1 hypothetical protein GQ61_00035 [Candidatus Nucleicultrix amoebiphila FS5]
MKKIFPKQIAFLTFKSIITFMVILICMSTSNSSASLDYEEDDDVYLQRTMINTRIDSSDHAFMTFFSSSSSFFTNYFFGNNQSNTDFLIPLGAVKTMTTSYLLMKAEQASEGEARFIGFVSGLGSYLGGSIGQYFLNSLIGDHSLFFGMCGSVIGSFIGNTLARSLVRTKRNLDILHYQYRTWEE